MTKQEIPLESRQQVVEELKKIKSNIILTSPILGIPESYLYTYKETCPNEFITLTEMQEIHAQTIIQDAQDLSFYFETRLALDLCKQLLQRNIENSKLRVSKDILEQNCTDFLVSMDKSYQKDYQIGQILESFLKQIDNKWEWLILDFDKPIKNASEIQKCMHQFMHLGPSKVILSAHDPALESKKKHHGFHIVQISKAIQYEQIQQEAINILHHVYGNWKHLYTIKKAIEHSFLKEVYEENNCQPEDFMAGIKEFYEAYQNIDAIDCQMEETELIFYIRDYILNHINKKNQKKKSKLYI